MTTKILRKCIKKSPAPMRAPGEGQKETFSYGVGRAEGVGATASASGETE